MAIPLGRSFVTDPTFMVWQVLTTSALYFITLGITSYAIACAAYVSFHAFSADSHATTSLSSRLFAYLQTVPLSSLFSQLHEDQHVAAAIRSGGSGGSTSSSSISGLQPPSVPSSTTPHEVYATLGGDVRFLLLHVVTSFVSALAIARVIQRSRFVLDFTFTIHLLYLIMACIVLSWSTTVATVWWWVSVLAGAAVMFVTMMYVCRRLEMRDIEMVPLHTTTSSTGALPPTNLPVSGNAAVVVVAPTASPTSALFTTAAEVSPGSLGSSLQPAPRGGGGFLGHHQRELSQPSLISIIADHQSAMKRR